MCPLVRYLKYSTDFEFTQNNEIPNPLTCYFLKRKQQRPAVQLGSSDILNKVGNFQVPVIAPDSRRRSDSGPEGVSIRQRDYSRRGSSVDPPTRLLRDRRPSALPAISTVVWPNGVVPASRREVARRDGVGREEEQETDEPAGASVLVYDETDDAYLTNPLEISQKVDRLRSSAQNGTLGNKRL